ncbi:MAG: hypothetical protein ACFFD4_34855 [Candidatus Odinarchaeota archaeon]
MQEDNGVNETGSGEKQLDQGVKNTVIEFPLPEDLYREIVTCCRVNGLSIEDWCLQQIVKRLELLQVDDLLRWETFFTDLYYSAIIALEKWVHGKVVSEGARIYLDRYAEPLVTFPADTREGAPFMTVRFSVPFTSEMLAVLAKLCACRSQTVEEWCASVILAVIHSALRNTDEFIQLFTEEIEEEFNGACIHRAKDTKQAVQGDGQ